MSKFSKVCLKIGNNLFTFAAAISLINCLFLPFARQNYKYPFLPMFCSFCLTLIIFYCMNHRDNALSELEAEQKFSKCKHLYMAISTCIFLLFGWLLEYTPMGDNFMLYKASQVLAENDHFEKGSDFILYFCRFSNQWGFLLILTFFFKLLRFLHVSGTFYPLVLFQIMLYLPAIHCLLWAAKTSSGPRGALHTLRMIVFCLPLFLATTVLYTDTFSMPFVIFTFAAGIKILQSESFRSRFLWACIGGLTTFIGAQIKMTVIIVLVAIAIILFLRIPFRQFFALLVVLFSPVLIGTSLVHNYTLDRYLDRAIYKQENTPIIHWVMMSVPDDDNPYGGFSQDYALTWRMMDEGASHKEVMDSIYSRLKDKVYHLRYPSRLLLALLRKNSAIMGDGTFGMTEMLDDGPVRRNIISEIVLENGRFYPIYSSVTTGIWNAQLLLAIFASFRIIKKRQYNLLIAEVACFGIILFLMFWEARSRYLFSYVPLFLLLSSTESYHVFSTVLEKLRNKVRGN